MRLLGLLVCAALLAGPALAQGDAQRCAEGDGLHFCVADAYPLQGDAVVLTLHDAAGPVAGAEVTAIYRPNSSVEKREAVGVSATDGTLPWVPADAGLVTLEARHGERVADMCVSVRYRHASAVGIFVLILAGMILFGGNGYSFAKTFGRES